MCCSFGVLVVQEVMWALSSIGGIWSPHRSGRWGDMVRMLWWAVGDIAGGCLNASFYKIRNIPSVIHCRSNTSEVYPKPFPWHEALAFSAFFFGLRQDCPMHRSVEPQIAASACWWNVLHRPHHMPLPPLTTASDSESPLPSFSGVLPVPLPPEASLQDVMPWHCIGSSAWNVDMFDISLHPIPAMHSFSLPSLLSPCLGCPHSLWSSFPITSCFRFR